MMKDVREKTGDKLLQLIDDITQVVDEPLMSKMKGSDYSFARHTITKIFYGIQLANKINKNPDQPLLDIAIDFAEDCVVDSIIFKSLSCIPGGHALACAAIVMDVVGANLGQKFVEQIIPKFYDKFPNLDSYEISQEVRDEYNELWLEIRGATEAVKSGPGALCVKVHQSLEHIRNDGKKAIFSTVPAGIKSLLPSDNNLTQQLTDDDSNRHLAPISNSSPKPKPLIDLQKYIKRSIENIQLNQSGTNPVDENAVLSSQSPWESIPQDAINEYKDALETMEQEIQQYSVETSEQRHQAEIAQKGGAETQEKYLLAQGLIDVAEEAARLVYASQQANARRDNFEERKSLHTQIHRQVEKSGLNVDLIKCIQENQSYTYLQMQPRVNHRFVESILIELQQKEENYKNAGKQIEVLKKSLSNINNFIKVAGDEKGSLEAREKEIITKINKLKYELSLSKASGVLKFLSSSLKVLNVLGKIDVNPLTHVVLNGASLALDFIENQKNNRTEKRLKKHGRDLDKTREQLSSLQRELANYEEQKLLRQSAINSLDMVQLANADSAGERTSLVNRINEKNEESKPLGDEKIKLQKQISTLELKINNCKQTLKDMTKGLEIGTKKYKEVTKGRSYLIAEQHLKSAETQLAAAETKLGDIEGIITTKNNEVTALQTNLGIQQTIAPLNDYFDQRLQKMKTQYSTDDMTKLIRLTVKKGIAEYREFYAEQDEAIETTLNTAAATFSTYQAAATTLGLSGAAWFLRHSLWVTQGVLFLYQAHRIADVMIESGNVLAKTIQSSNDIIDGLKNFSLTKLLTEFVNPSLGLLRIAANFANLISGFFGFELFPDPIKVQFKQIAELINNHSRRIAEGLQLVVTKSDILKQILLENRELIERNLNLTHKVSDEVARGFNHIEKVRAKESDNKILEALQKIRESIIRVCLKPNYKPGELESLQNLSAKLLSHVYNSKDPNFSKITATIDGLDVIPNPLDAINIIAEKIQGEGHLPNYRILYPVIKVFLANLPESHSVDIQNNKIFKLLTPYYENLSHLHKFLNDLRDKSQWVEKLRNEIMSQIAFLHSKVGSRILPENLENEVTKSESDRFNEVKLAYEHAKLETFGQQWFYKDREHACENAKKFIENELTALSHNQFESTLSSRIEKIGRKVNKYKFNQDKTAKSGAAYYFSTRHAKHYKQREKEDSPLRIAIQKEGSITINSNEVNANTIHYFLHSKNIYFNNPYCYIDLDNIAYIKKFKSYNKNLTERIENYLKFLTSVIYPEMSKSSENRNNFFDTEGEIIFDHNNKSVPLFFPTKLITTINTRLQVLYEIENLKMGVKTLEYVFKATPDGKGYELSLRGGCIRVNGKSNESRVYTDVVIAKFDYVTVHAHSKVTLNDDNYTCELNASEFLILAMYGSSIQGLGLAGMRSFDILNGADTQEGKSMVIAHTIPFVGLYRCFDKAPTIALDFHHENYSNSVAIAFEKFIKDDSFSNLLVPFFINEQPIQYGFAMMALEDELASFKKMLAERMRGKFTDAEKLNHLNIFSEISTLYEVFVSSINLLSGMSYKYIANSITRYLGLPHPYLLKRLYDQDAIKFLLFISEVEKLIPSFPKFKNVYHDVFSDICNKVDEQMQAFKNLELHNQQINNNINYEDIFLPTQDDDRQAYTVQLLQQSELLIAMSKELLTAKFVDVFNNLLEENKPQGSKTYSFTGTPFIETTRDGHATFVIANGASDYFYNEKDIDLIWGYIKKENKTNEKIFFADTTSINGQIYLPELVRLKQTAIKPSLLIFPIQILNMMNFLIAELDYEKLSVKYIWDEPGGRDKFPEVVKRLLNAKFSQIIKNLISNKAQQVVRFIYTTKKINQLVNIDDSSLIALQNIEDYCCAFAKDKSLEKIILNSQFTILPSELGSQYPQKIESIRRKHLFYILREHTGEAKPITFMVSFNTKLVRMMQNASGQFVKEFKLASWPLRDLQTLVNYLCLVRWENSLMESTFNESPFTSEEFAIAFRLFCEDKNINIKDKASTVLQPPTTGAIYHDKKITIQPSNKMAMKILTTVGDGNCFFHACFGEKNQRGELEAKDAKVMREEWFNYLNQFSSLNDSNMPEALHEEMQKILEYCISNPEQIDNNFSDVTAALRQRHEADIPNIKAMAVKEDILGNLHRIIHLLIPSILNTKLHTKGDSLKANDQRIIINHLKEIAGYQHNQQVAEIDIKKLLAKKDEIIHYLLQEKTIIYTKNWIANDLKNLVMLFKGITSQQYDSTYTSNTVAIKICNDPGLYSAYLRAISSQTYFVFIEEIKLLASLFNSQIKIYHTGSSEAKTFEPNKEMIQWVNASANAELTKFCNRKKIVIRLDNQHFERIDTSPPLFHNSAGVSFFNPSKKGAMADNLSTQPKDETKLTNK